MDPWMEAVEPGRLLAPFGARMLALLVALAAVARRLGQPGDRPKR